MSNSGFRGKSAASVVGFSDSSSLVPGSFLLAAPSRPQEWIPQMGNV